MHDEDFKIQDASILFIILRDVQSNNKMCSVKSEERN